MHSTEHSTQCRQVGRLTISIVVEHELPLLLLHNCQRFLKLDLLALQPDVRRVRARNIGERVTIKGQSNREQYEDFLKCFKRI